MIRFSVCDPTIKLKNVTSVIYQSEVQDVYTGDYEVTPKVTRELTLETKRKVMKDDVVVKKMPQFEVANEAGGATLILGDEYYE